MRENQSQSALCSLGAVTVVSHTLSALVFHFHTMGVLQILTTIIDSDMRPNSWSCENLRAHESSDVLVCYIRSHEGQDLDQEQDLDEGR